ncbi:hypothetical protein ACIQNV_37285 [Streptomyces hydrogenans]|uniref:hypothetical protein n=1 Tax=Streptomyces hydrogenans TaxID=1873719 RepID=UPI0038241705
MSDMYDDFNTDADVDAEDALDALLAQHHSGLAATVGSALDVDAGLRSAKDGRRNRPASYMKLVRRTARESFVTYYVATEGVLNSFPWPTVRSAALEGVMDAVQYEQEQLLVLAQKIDEQRPACFAPSADSVSPDMAARISAEELNRLLTLLSQGQATKESAASGVEPAERLIEAQVRGWAEAMINRSETVVGDRVSTDRVAWMYEHFTERLDGLLILKQKIVKLFEDAQDGVFQLS